MYQQATKPRSIGDVLDASFKLYSVAFSPALPLSAAIAVLGCMPSIIPLFTGGALTDPLAIIAVLFSPAFLLGLLLALLASLACSIALLVQIEAVARRRSVGIGTALNTGLRRLLPVFVSTIVWGCIIAFGMLLLVLPGLIVMVSMVFAMPAIVLDDKGALESLGYSHRLVWGLWWHAATLVSVMGIPFLIVLLGPSLVIGVIAMVVALSPTALLIGEIALTVVASALLVPYMLALMLETYRDLKLRKESTAAARLAQAHGT
jgi:hypothetical protein